VHRPQLEIDLDRPQRQAVCVEGEGPEVRRLAGRQQHVGGPELEARRLAAEVERKETIRRAFSRYVSPRLTAKIIDDTSSGSAPFKAQAERADVVAAVTGHDEDNLIIAQVAKRRFNVPRTVARINNPRNEFIFTELGIDATVSATQVILSVIQQEIPEHPLVHLLTLQEGGVEILQLQLTEDSPATGKAMGEISLPEDTAIPLLVRHGKPVVAHSDTVLEAEDKLIAWARTALQQHDPTRYAQVEPAFTSQHTPYQHL